MRISDWSSDVCSSDLVGDRQAEQDLALVVEVVLALGDQLRMVGVGQGPGRDAGAAVVAAPAGIEVIAVAGDPVYRTVGRAAASHADRGGRIGVRPGRDPELGQAAWRERVG